MRLRERQVADMEVRVENLCKDYGGQSVLQNVTFTAREGITCVMAPSGSGKTTLLRILLGLEQADSGTVETSAAIRWAAVFQEEQDLRTVAEVTAAEAEGFN